MNKDYLFERTGSDAEIEKLESVLSVYRFEPSWTPVLPENSPAARFWSFGWLRFSLATGAVAVAVLAGLLAYGRIEKLLLNADGPAISEVMRPAMSLPTIADAEQPQPDSKPEIATVNGDSFRSRRANAQPVRYRKRSLIHSIEKNEPTVAVTKQEKYAYDQLMVALYITGTKLKVVQNTIDRVDDKTDERANNEK